MEITTTKEHWENVFANKPENEVSWFQPYPKTSIEFIELFNHSSPKTTKLYLGVRDSEIQSIYDSLKL